jgi:hypothetical protein
MASLNDYTTGKTPARFQPRPFYSAEGDCLTFYFNEAESYAERVDERLTVFRSLRGNELVGCQIKGVRYLLKQLGNFGIFFSIKDGHLHLKVIILAYALSAKRLPPQETLQELNEAAEQQQVRVPALDLAAA